MKIVESNAVLVNRKNINQMEIVEFAGRTCYKSLEKITPGSAIDFCKRMKASKHYAMLEHGIIHVLVDLDFFDDEEIEKIFSIRDDDEEYKFLNITRFIEEKQVLITGSFRGWLEFFETGDYGENRLQKAIHSKLGQEYVDIFEDHGIYSTTDLVTILSDDQVIEKLQNYYADEKENKKAIMKHIYHTVVFTCDRGVSHEFVRHRPASFGQESTRYCDYTKDKHGNEITVVKPCDLADDPKKLAVWIDACEYAEKAYFKLREMGATAQNARGVLPTDLKTEIVITANEKEWQHLINLRYHATTGAPHPHMLEVMTKAYPILVEDSDNRLQ